MGSTVNVCVGVFFLLIFLKNALCELNKFGIKNRNFYDLEEYDRPSIPIYLGISNIPEKSAGVYAAAKKWKDFRPLLRLRRELHEIKNEENEIERQKNNRYRSEPKWRNTRQTFEGYRNNYPQPSGPYNTQRPATGYPGYLNNNNQYYPNPPPQNRNFPPYNPQGPYQQPQNPLAPFPTYNFTNNNFSQNHSYTYLRPNLLNNSFPGFNMHASNSRPPFKNPNNATNSFNNSYQTPGYPSILNNYTGNPYHANTRPNIPAYYPRSKSVTYHPSPQYNPLANMTFNRNPFNQTSNTNSYYPNSRQPYNHSTNFQQNNKLNQFNPVQPHNNYPNYSTNQTAFAPNYGQTSPNYSGNALGSFQNSRNSSFPISNRPQMTPMYPYPPPYDTNHQNYDPRKVPAGHFSYPN